MPHREKGLSKSRRRRRRARRGGDAPFRLRGRFWIDGPEGTFLGYGRVVLMERIREQGSITRAAKSMGMSYRHAWELIDSMNRQAPRPFVLTAAGGRGGGGTVVTEAGLEAIGLFRRLEAMFSEHLATGQDVLRFEKEES
ncbi:MAG: LysR family transcriptional regulator [Nitrospirota bacterium]|jgi:molybdate transport system regulatory protein